MDVLRRLVKQGKKLDDISVDTLKAARRREARRAARRGGSGPREAGIRLDETGKLHSPDPKLPDRIPEDWTPDQLEDLATDLRQSIATRNHENAMLGEDALAGRAHRRRIGEEERLLLGIEKLLGGT
jgi:hypothetical protein